MINCKYEYKGHLFNNEVELDDFLLSKKKYESTFGDMIYSVKAEKLGTLNKVQNLDTQTKNMKKAFTGKTRYIDGEDISERPKPYVGVTAYLAKFTTPDGHPLFPIFQEEEYWKRRRLYWADESQDLEEEYDSEKGTGVYTKDERELIFGNDPVRRLTKDEMDIWQAIITEKWQQQGILGSELHHVLEMYFHKYKGVYNFTKFKDNREGLINIIERNVSLPREVINKTLDFAEQLQYTIKDKLGNDVEFYPELKISGDLDVPTAEYKTLVGSIDLLVIDGDGNAHIFDYKTSPKEYVDYNSAKVRTFMYQFATYNRLLQRYGIKDINNRQFVSPLRFDNFHLTNKDEAIADPSKAKFAFDNVIWQEESGKVQLEELTSAIRNDDNLNGHLNSFLSKSRRIIDVDADKLIERVREDEGQLFGGQVINKTYNDAKIAELIENIEADPETGKYMYETPVGYQDKGISANTKEELFNKVKAFYDNIETGGYRRARTIVDAVKTGKKNGASTMDEVLKYMNVKKLFDETGQLDFLKNSLTPYLGEEWDLIEDEGALFFGLVLFKNRATKQVDAIKISGKNLDWKLYHEKVVNGKKIQNTRRSNLTFAFEPDMVESKIKNSGMLKATIGNIETIEALLVLNQKYSLFEDGSTIGHIQVINPFTGQSSAAPNWQLEYSYKKLRQHQKIYDGIDRINDGNLKFASLLDLAEHDLHTELERESHFISKGDFKSALTVLDNAEDNQDKLAAINKILKLFEDKYHNEVAQLRSNNSSREARLYNKLLLAAAELRDIKFKQQTERTDKWPSLSIKKFLKEGLSSSYIDNPGNLDSETLNLLTQLVTEGYQNIRTEMTDPIAKTRKLVEKLKDSKNFNWVASRTIGNETSIFKNMFDTSYKDDIVLKNVNDSSLSSEEREFLEYFLETVNKNRYPGKSDLELKQMKENGSIEYYRIPLARGSVSSEISMNGLFSTLKSRLSKWTPRNALKEMRAEAEGFFTEKAATSIDHSNVDLFEMNNRFARGDSDTTYRKESIEENERNGNIFFERNLETLLLEHTFAYTTKRQLDQIFPMIRAAMTHLKVMGEDEQNRQFDTDIEYATDYIKAIIKNQPIDDTIKEMEMKAITSKIKQAASFTALAFSPVMGLYQSIQGFWVAGSLILRKPDGSNAFTFQTFSRAFHIVYNDAFHWSEEPTKVQLLNELYGVNDMDMNTYLKNIKSDKHGILNAYDLAFKFASRPDYYNRMAILVAQMIEDGTWDAYEVVNGKLVYKFEKDKRFEHLRTGQTLHPDYAKERALYYAIAQQHVIEGTKNADGTLFKIDPNKIVPLPQAHTIQEIESFKALGDLLYGYYSHEKKSLIHYTFYGALFMQMRTYWSGKKNQYLAPGGVRVQGHWAQAKDAEGNNLYYQIIDGKIRTDLEPVTENTGAPVVQWQGIWQEGILVTLSNIAQGMHDYYQENDSLDIFAAFRDAVNQRYTNDEDRARAYYANIKQLVYDLSMFATVGGVAAGWLADWEKELAKEAKSTGSISDGLKASMVNILAMSVHNSAADFAFFESIGTPAVQWTPFAFETGARLWKNIWNTAIGDKTFWGGVTNTFAVTKQFRPLMQNIAPLYEKSE